jgi:quercetin dioxygenase-like cupin family protein
MTYTNTTRAIAGVLLLSAICFGAPALQARERGAPQKVEAEHIVTTPLAGNPDKEIDIQIYTFPPESAVPWHVHKDAIEIEYALEGSIILEEEDKPPYEIAEGTTNVLSPNVVHRGWNPSKTDPATLYVVRIKPKGAPLATIVPAPPKAAGNASSETAGAPAAGDYPEDD